MADAISASPQQQPFFAAKMSAICSAPTCLAMTRLLRSRRNTSRRRGRGGPELLLSVVTPATIKAVALSDALPGVVRHVDPVADVLPDEFQPRFRLEVVADA